MPNPTLAEPYIFGTISIANGSTEVIGADTLWSTQAVEGDWIYVAGKVVPITADVEDEKLILAQPWEWDAVVGSAYQLMKTSWLRYEPAITQQQVNLLIQMLNAQGVFYFVSGDEPDPGMGQDTQWAIKINTGIWTLWYKQDGVWVAKGSPAGIVWESLWEIDHSYGANDVVRRLGNAYISINPDANLGHDPAGEVDPDNPVWWDLFSSGGGRYDLWFGDSDQPTDGEVLFKGYPPVDIEFPLNLAQSVAKVDIAPTADCTFSIQHSDTEFAQIKFLAGETTATMIAASAHVIPAGDKLSIVTPTPRDSTLRGLAATLTAYRS